MLHSNENKIQIQGYTEDSRTLTNILSYAYYARNC